MIVVLVGGATSISLVGVAPKRLVERSEISQVAGGERVSAQLFAILGRKNGVRPVMQDGSKVVAPEAVRFGRGAPAIIDLALGRTHSARRHVDIHKVVAIRTGMFVLESRRMEKLVSNGAVG